MAASGPQRCNILVTGVPGVGKTTFAARLAERLATAFPAESPQVGGPEWEHLDVGKLIREEGLHAGVDEEYLQSIGLDAPTDDQLVYVLDEDRVVDALEERMWGSDIAPHPGHKIVDFHTVDFFPERWFHVVVLLRCVDNTAALFDRLSRRGYPLAKVQENVQAEIMDVVANEVRDSYDEDLILELPSVNPDDVDENAERVVEAVAAVLGVHPLPDPYA